MHLRGVAFDRGVCADQPTVLSRVVVQQVGDGFAEVVPEAPDGLAQVSSPPYRYGLGRRRIGRFHREHGFQDVPRSTGPPFKSREAGKAMKPCRGCMSSCQFFGPVGHLAVPVQPA